MSLSAINDNRDVKTNTPDGRALRVSIAGDSGQAINEYGEANSVASLGTATILTYTVPASKQFKLRRVNYSGENRALYSIEINGSAIAKHRTYFTEYNGSSIFEGLMLSEGDILRVIVENKSASIADFNSNVQGQLTNA